MAATTDPTKNGDAQHDDYELPDVLTDANISETRRELLQLLYDNPGQPSSWYESRLDVADTYLAQFRYRYSGLIEHTKEQLDNGGKRYYYRLAEPACKALLAGDVIEGDGLDCFEQTAEEPSQRYENGNVSFEGQPLDMTWQGQDERPVKGDVGTTVDDEAIEDLIVEAEGVAEAQDGQPTYALELDEGDVFEIINTADAAVARRVFDQVIGK